MQFYNNLNGELSNGNIITLTYKLKNGYEWNNGKKNDVTLNYKVENLKVNSKKGIALWKIITIASGILGGLIILGIGFILYRKFRI